MKSYEIRQQYFDECRAEANRIMNRLGIEEPRCGFGIGLGWMPVVERALEEMIAAGWDRELHQVKQKFCGLRIYIGAGQWTRGDELRPTSIGAAILRAEKECESICEVCGKEREKKGTRSGWALCDACEASDGKAF